MVRRLALIAPTVMVGALLGGAAVAQLQTSAQQKCINTINKDIAKVAAAVGKRNIACVKAAARAEATPACLLGDPKGKIAKARAKTSADQLERCPVPPAFGFTGATLANDAAEQLGQNVITDLFATTDLTTVIVPANPDGGCQTDVAKALAKMTAAAFKKYNKCKKQELRDAIAPGPLEQCLTIVVSDAFLNPKSAVGKAMAKLTGAASNACGPPVIQSLDFPGVCATGALDACAAARARCRLCQAINTADGLATDCDSFDNGASDASCTAAISAHTCVLGAGSTLTFHTAAPMPMTFGLSGAVDIAASGGNAACNIEVIDPFAIPSIGVVCIEPGGPCSGGTRDCAGGAPVGTHVVGHGLAGSCSSNATCDVICNGLCGGPSGVLNSGCTGHCAGPSPQLCTNDADCLPVNGNCNGFDPISPMTANICQCSCIDRAAHGPGVPGELQCEVGVEFTVEAAAPCDDTDVTIALRSTCVPMSTRRASAQINQANYGSTPSIPQVAGSNDQSGTALTCPGLDDSGTAGMELVGAFNLFGVTLFGDTSFGVRAVCE